MQAEAMKDLFRRYVGIWESGAVECLPEVIHPAYRGHPAQGERDGNGLRERILAFKGLYPDVSFALGDQLAEGDRVASRMTATATRAADGQRVVLHGLNISRVAEGRIAEEWMAWEVVPAP